MRVQRVQKVQRVQRVQRGGLTALRAEGCGRLSAAGCVRFAQGATAPAALRVAASPSRAMSFISRLRRSRQHRVSILSAYLVHPFPLRGTSPQGETRALRDLLSVSYDIVSILVISRCAAPPYPATPDFLHGKACHTILRSLRVLTNRVPLPPLFRGQNKTPRNILFISISTVR